MTGDVLIVCAVFLFAAYLAFELWSEARKREQRQRSRDLRRRLSWYIHGRGL